MKTADLVLNGQSQQRVSGINEWQQSDLLLMPPGITQLLTMLGALHDKNISWRGARVLSICGVFNSEMRVALETTARTFGMTYEGNFPTGLTLERVDLARSSAEDEELWQKDPSTFVSSRLLKNYPELGPYRGLRLVIPTRPNMQGDFLLLSALQPRQVVLVADGIQNERLIRNKTGEAWRGFCPTLAQFPTTETIWCPAYLLKDTMEIGQARVIAADTEMKINALAKQSPLGEHLEWQILACGEIPRSIILSQHFSLSQLCSKSEEIQYYSQIISHLLARRLTPILFKRHPRDPDKKMDSLKKIFAANAGEICFTDNLASCLPIEMMDELWKQLPVTVCGSSSSALLGLNWSSKVERLCAIGNFLPAPLHTQVSRFAAKHNLRFLDLDQQPAISSKNNSPVGGKPSPAKSTILFVSHDASRSGAPFFLLHLLRWLKANTDIAFKILLRAGGPLEADFHALGETFTPDTFGRDRRNLADVGLIYSNTCTNAELLESLAVGNIPVITHVHELDYAIAYFGQKNWDSARRQTRHYFACADAVVQSLSQRHGIASAKISRHYEAIPTAQVIERAGAISTATARAAFGLPQDAFLIAACGSADSRKGADLFIKLAEILKRDIASGREIRLIWIGRFPDEEHRRRLLGEVARLKLDDILHFVGEQENPFPLLNACDLFALTSREDPFPLVMLEAATLGKPTVCFENAGGAPEFCQLGGGVVVPHLDVQAMSAACRELMKDTARRLQIGSAAANLARERFDISVVCAAIWRELRAFLQTATIKNQLQPGEDLAMWDQPAQTLGLLHGHNPAPQVSIVIPVYGNLKYTTMCLDAITRNTPELIAYEIIVVDDASSDGTQEFLQAAPKFYPRLRSVRLNENSGFSSACNAGAAAARGEYVLFLNNDTEPCAGWLEGMLNVFQREPLAGVVGSLLLFPRRSENAAEPDRVQHCGIVFNAQKEALHLYKFCLTNQPFVRQTREYQAVTAACMMLPRDVFNSAGGFSKNYLNGGEDLDLCFKIRAQGRKVIVAVDSVVRHHESVSVKSGHNSGNANYRRFLESWGGQIQADEELFYERDGVRAAGKMRIAMVTPLRPLKTGVADYVEELLPALTGHARVDFFVDDLAPDNPEILRHHFVHSLHDIAGADWTYNYDAVIYHVGNNRFHAEIYKLAANRPGIVVLHEYDCRGCGSENSSRRHLRGLLRRAQAMIVHNEHSRQLLRREFPELPAFVIPHLLSHKALQTGTPENARARIGLPKDAFIIVSLGLVQLHKRNHITLEAFAKFSRRHANALLLLAGEAPDPAFRNYLNKQIQDHGLQNKVRITGWLSDEQFFDCLSAADVTVNLRYPARGEESGSLTRILGCGKPAIVSNFAQFADIPDDCVIKINFENEVEELIAAWEQLLNDPAQREARSARAREFYRAQNDVERVAALYAEVCRQTGRINEATLQLRQPRYQFDWHTLAQVVWEAPVFAPKDQSRPLILALDKLKVPVCVRAQRNVDSEAKLINSEDVERLNQLTALDATEGFIQVYAGDPTQFQRAAGARAVVAWVQTLGAGEIAAWCRLPANEFWAVSDPVRNALIQAGADAEKITVVPAGVPLLSYGATVNELRPSGLFRFICVTDWSAGSGWDATLRAFLKEFGGQEVAQLIFKNSMTHLSLEEKSKLFQQALGRFFRDNPEFKPEQFRMVNTDNSNYPDDYMASFYCSGNALVQPTQNGVGCRAVLEASVLGLPVITTELGQLEKHGEKPTAFIVRTLLKNGRTVVDDSHLRQLMRQLLARRLESQLPGIRARQQILATRTWEAIAEQAAIRLAGLLDPAPASAPDVNSVGASQSQRSTSAAAPVGENLPCENPQPAAPIAALSCQLRWQSPIFDPSGYADESRYLLRSLQRHAPVRLEPIARLSKKFYDEMDRSERADLERMIATPLAKEFIQLTIAPAYALKREAGAGYAVGRSTFETDRLPMEWVAACNHMDEIWVPTAFNVETFKRAGVHVPIHIVPQGVDSDRFHPGLKPLPIAGRRRFAFLSVFEWIHRKGWDVLLRAWAETFTADENVCLLIRSYLPNVTEGGSSTTAINERIDQFLQKELGRTRASVAPIIVLGEQLPQLDMPRLYASADCFVLPTRGEGWGRPYIEAMACGLPVIGTNWGGQLAFMHEGNSLLLDIESLETVDAKMEFPFYRGHQWARPSVAHLKQLLRRVANNPAEAKKLGEAAAAEVRTKWNWENAGAAMRTQLAAIEARLAAAKPGPRAVISWEGSFLDHGSLSHVNRELVGALQDFPGPQIKCVTNGGPVAADAATSWPQLVNKVSTTPAPDAAITVRHAWPPNWKRPASGKLAVIQPWEFGVLPQEWVRQARDVDEFWLPSEYVRRVYVESGVPAEKVFVVPNGVDAEKFNPQAAPMKLATAKKFKFLFVGGTIGRKGPDLLLQAYLKNFTAADDVCLVIKDFGGQSVYTGQTFEAQIRAAQSQPNAPEILYLNEELSPNQLPRLYTACDCFVLPYRGEGFGLPALEAMACGLPVIVTAGGATDDFVRDEFAYRIPAVKKIFGREVGGMKLAGDGWLLEPSFAALGEIMRHVFNHPAEARERGQLASHHAHLHGSWKNSAAIAARRIRELSAIPITPAKPAAKPMPAKLPGAAQVGQLAEARELFGQKKLEAAWNATTVAVAQRPFHPEAFLLLAEIALAAGDGKTAKLCAQLARNCTPGWQAPKQFLSKPLKRAAKPDWLVLPESIGNRLSVCLIVKNEEKFLAQCLKSVRGLAAQIVVVDTGSTDRTVEIAREFGAEIYSFAWCDDFAAARNAALEHATGDWILMLDADEELPAAQHTKLRADMKNSGAIAFRLPLINVGQENEGRSFIPRLFRNAPGVFFHGRIHEQVFSSLLGSAKKWGLKTALGTAEILHHGYSKEMVRDRNKVERNLKLLRAAIEENPADVNLVMNLGLELVRSDDLTGGIEKYREAYELMSAQPVAELVPELREVLLTQFTSQLYKVRGHEEIVQVLNSPLAKRGGLTASLHFILGLAHFERRRFSEAADQMRQCLAKRKQLGLTPINTDILTAAPSHCLALSLAKLDDKAGAEKAFAAALAETGHVEAAKLDYAKLLQTENRPVDALHQLNKLVAANSRHVAAWRLGGEIALSKPEFLEFARDWTGEAIKALPENPVIAAQRAEALMLSGDPAAAAELWEKIWRSEPDPRALAALILCQIASPQTVHLPNAGDEPATSRAFIEWYQKLIAARAQSLTGKINGRLDQLSGPLPSAAQMIEAALSEADVPAEV